jgi:hypothetical protein
MKIDPSPPANRFSSVLPITVSTRQVGGSEESWRELDRGPGFFAIPPGYEGSVRIHNIDDDTLSVLVEELAGCRAIAEIVLSENRKITDRGLISLCTVPQATSLNLSSCNLTDAGLETLAGFSRLDRLNLSYCNRITDAGLKKLRALANLSYLDLQGCVKVSNGGISKLRRPGLTIHK